MSFQSRDEAPTERPLPSPRDPTICENGSAPAEYGAANVPDEQQSYDLDLAGTAWIEPSSALSTDLISRLPAKLSCRVLRSAPRRRVLHVPGAPALLIKQYFQRGPLDRLKTMARGSSAAREWRALREAQRRGLPVPKPLALGSSARQSLIVMEFIESAISLDDFLREQRAFGVKRPIVREVARLMRRMHDAGLFQRDLHLGNVLVCHRDFTRAYFLLDLQRVDIDPFRSPAMRWRDLAALAGGSEYASRSDRLRFFQAYMSVAPRVDLNKRRLLPKLERKVRRHRFRLWRSRQKRCLADNREFAAMTIGDFRGFVRRSEWKDGLASLLSAPGRILASAVIAKDSPTTTVGIVSLPERKVFVKTYKRQGPFYAFKDLFRSSRARRGWKAGNSCHLRGVGVALPLAYLERRRFRLLRESYLITAAVAGEELARVVAGQADDFRAKRLLIRQLARWLRAMHERGISHRDLKSENIIARTRGDGSYDFFIVDFDGISYGAVSPRARAKNLARLARGIAVCVRLSFTDRPRFVKYYLADRRAAHWRDMYRDVVKFENRFGGRRPL